MINLLPREDKREVYAGRSNSLLVRYVFLMLAVIAVIILMLVGVYVYLGIIKSNAQTRITSSQSEHQALVKSEQEINTFRSNLATAQQILDKRVDYSAVILRVAAAIPDGIVLDNLALDPSTFGTPTEISVNADSEQAILNMKNTFNQSRYFSDAHINTISKSETEGGSAYMGTLTVTFSKELLAP